MHTHPLSYCTSELGSAHGSHTGGTIIGNSSEYLGVAPQVSHTFSSPTRSDQSRQLTFRMFLFASRHAYGCTKPSHATLRYHRRPKMSLSRTETPSSSMLSCVVQRSDATSSPAVLEAAHLGPTTVSPSPQQCESSTPPISGAVRLTSVRPLCSDAIAKSIGTVVLSAGNDGETGPFAFVSE